MNDSLYKNSIYLMASTGIMSVLGFVFWIIVARYFDPPEVGLATAIISVMGLITGLSTLGLNVALIRFLPNSKRKNDKINTTFTLVTIVTIIITSIYLMGINFFTPDLLFIKESLFLALSFILFMVVSSFNMLIESIFIAFRDTKYNLIRNTIFSVLKIIIPLIFIFFGIFGSYVIFGSWMLALAIASVYCFYVLIKVYKYRPKFVFHDSIIKNIGGYSFGNYIANFIGGINTMILPLIILSSLGSEKAAYYYITLQIATLLYIIPRMVSNSLFAEGSYHENNIKLLILKAIKIIYVILLPAITFIIIFGKYLLNIFGDEYSKHGYTLLVLLALSTLILSLNNIFGSLYKIKKFINIIIIGNILNSFSILILSLYFLKYDIVGLGYAYILAQFIVLCFYLFIFYKK